MSASDVGGFVDTNVLLYAIGAAPENTAKRERAHNLLVEDSRLVLSVQVLAEFYHQATHSRRDDAITPHQAIEFIDSIEHIAVQDVTLGVFRDGVSISRRFRISYWDGAILAAARAAECDVVYSEDLSHGQDYGGVRVSNPFVDLQ